MLSATSEMRPPSGTVNVARSQHRPRRCCHHRGLEEQIGPAVGASQHQRRIDQDARRWSRDARAGADLVAGAGQRYIAPVPVVLAARLLVAIDPFGSVIAPPAVKRDVARIQAARQAHDANLQRAPRLPASVSRRCPGSAPLACPPPPRRHRQRSASVNAKSPPVVKLPRLVTWLFPLSPTMPAAADQQQRRHRANRYHLGRGGVTLVVPAAHGTVITGAVRLTVAALRPFTARGRAAVLGVKL